MAGDGRSCSQFMYLVKIKCNRSCHAWLSPSITVPGDIGKAIQSRAEIDCPPPPCSKSSRRGHPWAGHQEHLGVRPWPGWCGLVKKKAGWGKGQWVSVVSRWPSAGQLDAPTICYFYHFLTSSEQRLKLGKLYTCSRVDKFKGKYIPFPLFTNNLWLWTAKRHFHSGKGHMRHGLQSLWIRIKDNFIFSLCLFTYILNQTLITPVHSTDSIKAIWNLFVSLPQR